MEAQEEDYPLSACWGPEKVCKVNKNTFLQRMQASKLAKRAAREEKEALAFAEALEEHQIVQQEQEEARKNKENYKTDAAICAAQAQREQAATEACKAAEKAEEEEERAAAEAAQLAAVVAEAQQQVLEDVKEESQRKQAKLSAFFKVSSSSPPTAPFLHPSLVRDNRGRKRALTVTEARELCAKAQKGEQLRQAEAALRSAEERHREAEKHRKGLEEHARKLERDAQKMKAAETRGRKRKEPVEPECSAVTVFNAIERAEQLQQLRKQIERKRPGDGKERLRKEPKPLERQAITKALDLQIAEGTRRGKEFWEAASKEHGIAVLQLKNLLTAEGRKKTEAGVAGFTGRGRKRYWKTLLRYRSQGQRKSREDLHGGSLREQKEAVKAWCKEEMSQGHDVSGEDLLYQYEAEVEDLLYRLKIEKEAKVAAEQLKGALEAERAERVPEPRSEIYTGRLLSQLLEEEKAAVVAKERLSTVLGKSEERSLKVVKWLIN